MKPAPFRYFAPTEMDEALALLEEYGDEAKVLAGGQSLGPMMNLRLATPSVLVDINNVQQLQTAPELSASTLTLSAITRQRDAERDAHLVSAAPLVVDALRYVAHPAIRNRGTVGGSLAHADPAAELPAVLCALDGVVTVRSIRGGSSIPAESLFVGYFETRLSGDELLVGIEIPRIQDGTGCAWEEFAVRHGDFAIVGVAAVVRMSLDGVVDEARIVSSGTSDVPMRLSSAEAMLNGVRPEEPLLVEAARAGAQDTDPATDLVATGEYRRHLLAMLTQRAVARAIAAAQAE